MPEKLLEFKNDLVFQELFGNPKNIQITGHLLSLILKREVYKVDLDINKRMLRNSPDLKIGRLDIRVKFNDGEECNIREKDNSEMKLTNDIEMHILEIPKIKSTELEKDELAQWLKFIDKLESEEVKMFMSQNKYWKQAMEELEYLSGEEDFQRLVEARYRFLADQGMEIEESEKKGRDSKAKEIAKKMKDKNMPIDEIIELTGLTKEEIEKL